MAEVTDFAVRREALVERYLRPEAERPASTARGVHHVALICSDPARTIDFYQGLLGFPLVELFENRDSPGSMHFFFDIGHDNLLAFFDFPGVDLDRAVEAIGSLQHVALSVTPEQFDAAKRRLDAAGIEYLGPDRGVYDSLYFRDPDGIQIELTSQPLRGMPTNSLVALASLAAPHVAGGPGGGRSPPPRLRMAAPPLWSRSLRSPLRTWLAVPGAGEARPSSADGSS